ncbi:MAG: glutathione S-transferase family protein [Proteobacteria bacterium]|nr:glutathione S-transferase family protein [Pseudomonadota bacterium]MDA1021875.1 glutathione S-transferase family protein [Pseudomonadota bacterium]
MSSIIIHHYPQSPVSEKVRVALGFKDLDWHSVIIPRLPPKPDLMPLTGGYRLTPVMQIGADVFCDTQCILREIERQKPEPTLFPGGGHGMAWGVGRWTDGALFDDTVKLVFGDAYDDMPEDFKNDRGPLYFGPGFDLESLKHAIPETLVQMRAQLDWMDERLAGRDFMLGAAPGLPDALCYYIIWFVRGRYSKGPEFLSQFKNLMAWEERVKAYGHGRPRDMEASEALDIAKAATPATTKGGPADDLAGLKPGDAVAIVPTEVAGCVAVEGTILRIGTQEIAIARTDERVGDVAVHFPRSGYRVTKT